jgi:hypothetical protein
MIPAGSFASATGRDGVWGSCGVTVSMGRHGTCPERDLDGTYVTIARVPGAKYMRMRAHCCPAGLVRPAQSRGPVARTVLPATTVQAARTRPRLPDTAARTRPTRAPEPGPRCGRRAGMMWPRRPDPAYAGARTRPRLPDPAHAGRMRPRRPDPAHAGARCTAHAGRMRPRLPDPAHAGARCTARVAAVARAGCGHVGRVAGTGRTSGGRTRPTRARRP